MSYGFWINFFFKIRQYVVSYFISCIFIFIIGGICKAGNVVVCKKLFNIMPHGKKQGSYDIFVHRCNTSHSGDSRATAKI